MAIHLGARVGRNLMPGSNSGLGVEVDLQSSSTDALAAVDVERIFVIQGGDLWSVEAEDVAPHRRPGLPPGPPRRELRATNGPGWLPEDGRVDVVVRLDAGEDDPTYLAVRDRWIEVVF